jgi:hypothetical protein
MTISPCLAVVLQTPTGAANVQHYPHTLEALTQALASGAILGEELRGSATTRTEEVG